MIDAHVHLWEYNAERDAWITPDMAVIRRSFLPKDLRPFLQDEKVDGVVAVQADQSEQETEFLVSLAKENPEIKGVVGWIDLRQKELPQRLERFQEEKIIKGWRHIVQAEPKGFLENPTFQENVRLLGTYAYTYDILVYHYQLPEVLEFVSQLPEQALVIDHLAKPDLKTHQVEDWKKNMAALAEFPHLYCKLSGLVTEAEKGKWTKENLFSYLDFIVEKFGTRRVMFGSDWPVMLLNSHYAEWLGLVKEFSQQFSQEEQAQIFHHNAVNFYKL